MLASRRWALRAAAVTTASLFAAPYVAKARFAVSPYSKRDYSKRAIEVVQRSLVIDMLAVPRIDLTPRTGRRSVSL